MSMGGWIALAITVFGAASYAAASLLQAVAARKSVSTAATMKHPLYLAGIGCDVMAWVGSMIALRELAVYLVESVLAGSLALTVLGARLILKSRLRRRDIAAVVVSISALAVLASSAGPQHGVELTPVLRFTLCSAAITMVLFGWGAARAGAPAGLVAAMGGLCLGGAALTGRALGEVTGGVLGILTEPLTAAVLVFAATGMMLYAHALQNGQVGPVTAVHWSAEVLAPSAVALLLLGDTVRPGWEAIALVAGLVTAMSAVVLASAPGTSAAALPAEATSVPGTTSIDHEPKWTVPSGEPMRVARPATRPSVPLPRPATPPIARPADRIVWWGPPPIWRPPARTAAELAAAPRPAELTTGVPQVQALGTQPWLPDADVMEAPATEPIPAWMLAGTYPQEPLPERERVRPPVWGDQ